MRNILWTLITAVIWAAASGLLAARLSVPAAVIAAVAGSATGLIIGERLARSSIRFAAVWIIGASAALLATALTRTFVTGESAASVFGPSIAYTLREVVFWFLISGIAVAVLQASARRKPIFIAAQVVAIGAILDSVFAAHRDGFINRPYSLVDRLWAKGYDPLPLFVAAGLAAAAVLAFLAAHRSSTKRSFLDIVLLIALIGALFLAVPVGSLKKLNPPPGGSSGGKTAKQLPAAGAQGAGQPSQGQAGQSGGGSGSNQGEKAGGAGGAGDQGVPPPQDDSAVSSFDDQPSSSSNQPVAVVVLRDDYDPPAGYYYFRQTAFSQFNGIRLVQDTTGKADRDVADSFPVQDLLSLPVDLSQDWLYARLDTTVALIADHPRPFGLVMPTTLSPAANPDPTRFHRAYSVTSQVLNRKLLDLTGMPFGSRRWSDTLWAHYTSGPTDPRFGDVAGRIVDELVKPEYKRDPFAQAAAIKVWLEKNGTYSLESNHESSADPVSDFLFGDRTGHCVYFAHSACLLFRARGLPSRVGAGYAVDARNRGGGSSLLVRGKDAHAWPEVYIDEAGWVVLDISPEKSLAPPAEAPDQGLQQMLGEMVRQGSSGQPKTQEPPSKGNLQEQARQLARQAFDMLALLALLLLLLAYATKIWRRVAPHVCADHRLPVLAYRACLDRLADAGRLRRFGQTREEFARAHATDCPSFVRLSGHHLAAALGRTPPPSRRQDYIRLLGEAARELSAATSWWQLLAGTVNPFSWVRVK